MYNNLSSSYGSDIITTARLSNRIGLELRHVIIKTSASPKTC